MRSRRPTSHCFSLPSAKGFGSKLTSQVGGETRSAGSSLGKTFGKLFALSAGVIAAVGVKNLLSGSIDEAREAQKVGAQTNAVLKSTGGIANVSASQVGKLSTALSNKIGVDDEAIQAGQNMLLTFTNVRNEVGKGNNIFTQATRTVQDMAASFGGDATSNSKILGKALNDPVKGVSALTRVGVTFTQGQKDQIKTLVDSGNVLGAQKIILGELSKETDGSAKAQATFGDKAKVAFDNIKESIGTALLPLIDTLARQFLRLSPAIQKGIANIGPAFKSARAFLQPFIAGIASTVLALGTQLAPTIASIVGVVATFVGQIRSGTGAGGQFASIVATLASALGSVFGFISSNQAVVGTFVGIIATAAVVAKAFAAAQLLVNIALSANPIGLVVIAIAALVAGLVYAYKNSEKFRAVVDATFGFLSKFVPKAISFVVNFVKSHWKLLLVFILGPLALLIPVVIKHFDTIKRVVGAAADFVVSSAKKYAQFVSAVIDKVGKVVKFFRDLPGKIKGSLSGLPGALKTIGGHIIDGLVSGIKAAAHKVEDAVNAIVDKIPKKIRQIMGIASPSKVTKQLGEFISQGLADGIISKGDKVTKAVAALTGSLKSKLKDLASDFSSLAEPIASNFTQGLFDFDSAGAFSANLTTVKGTLSTLLDNFKKLKGEGLSPGFLYQLFQSGGPGLINSLAALSASDAQATGALFGQVTSLSDQLGGNVAGATQAGAANLAAQEKANQLLTAIEKHQKDFAQDVAQALNGAAAKGHRRSK